MDSNGYVAQCLLTSQQVKSILAIGKKQKIPAELMKLAIYIEDNSRPRFREADVERFIKSRYVQALGEKTLEREREQEKRKELFKKMNFMIAKEIAGKKIQGAA
jgi:hypothetical protein